MKLVKAKARFDEPVTTEALEGAVRRGRQRKSGGMHAVSVHHLAAFKLLLIGFSDGSAVALPIKNYAELANLTGADLKRVTVGFGGSALCLEKHDLHISIVGLVSASASLMEMATAVVAARNGSRSSGAKSAAARENGAKGGRPRKIVAGAGS